MGSFSFGKLLLGIAVLICFLSAGLAVGWTGRGWIEEDEIIPQIVALKWGDGKYGPAFYGACVSILPRQSGGYAVYGKIYIGRGNDYYHDLGRLGTVSTDVEAVQKWG